MLIEGKLPKETYISHCDKVKNYFLRKKQRETENSSIHYWINQIDDKEIKDSLEFLRNAPEIKQEIQKSYPKHIIKSVHSSDEVYISVDPSLRKNSDIALSDCHYDAPFKYVPQCGNKFIRVIMALNENKTTYTTIDNQKSLLSTLDFNAMDYNSDYHCVEGYIPKGDIRILLKLHFLCINPNSSNACVKFTESINDKWTHYSRELMRKSINPNTFSEKLLSKLILGVRKIYNNIDIKVILFLIVLFILYKVNRK